MSLPALRHQAIVASAGSGKTFQLAHRYLQLMARGVAPGRICALTFSRKAAGEIFESIVRTLREAAESEKSARAAGQRIGAESLRSADFLKLLRSLLDQIPRLHIGTLDSFAVGVVRTFPMELGVAFRFDVVDGEGAASRLARWEVLSRIFNHRYASRDEQRQFHEAFKQATFGREEKNLARMLDGFIEGYHARYQLLPDADAWGAPEKIWPEGCEWLNGPADVDAALAPLEEALTHCAWPPKAKERWRLFMEAVRRFDPGAPQDNDLEYLFEKLAGVVEGLRAGRASLSMDRKTYELDAGICKPVLDLMRHVMRKSLGDSLERTRGMHRILEQYERFYDEAIRRRGRLTFNDVQFLLTSGNTRSGSVLLSRSVGRPDRLYIDYRLDSRLDHWLLDEFQDTSDLQWGVLSNLADEILQDESGQRSFFFVGDVKQAIYRWRGGNARLFGRLLQHYGTRLDLLPLNTSFRSCRPVIATVNRVFGSLPDELPAGTLRMWRGLWGEHSSAAGNVPANGFAAILEPDCQGGREKPDANARYELVARLLRAMQPLARGLDVAVLVRENKHGKALVDTLRRETSFSIAHEGRASIQDSAAVLLLLALARFAAHPGDTLAGRHLHMSPIWPAVAARGPAPQRPKVLLGEIQAGGFRRFFQSWSRILDAATTLTPFDRRRLEQLCHAAGEFDLGGGRDVSGFRNFMEHYEILEHASDRAVRVMTVHQAKGLGFDVVILPDLQGDGIASAGGLDFLLARDPENEAPRWALCLPRGIFARQDPVLAEELAREVDAACFEELCVLYVAMTRARHALYMVTSFPGKSAAALNGAALVKSRLHGEINPTTGRRINLDGQEAVCLYAEGDPNWFRTMPAIPSPAVKAPAPAPGKTASGRRRLTHVSPSQRAEAPCPARRLFAPDATAGLDVGRAVHELFQRVAWVEDTDLEELVRDWRAVFTGPPAIAAAAEAHFRAAVAAAPCREALARPHGHVQLWREKSFEVVEGNEWISGTMDRVTIVRDENGRALSATVLDFKSNDVNTPEEAAATAEHYRPQLEWYARVLARMLDLPAERISARWMFTRPALVVQIQ